MFKRVGFIILLLLLACSKEPVMYTLTATANPAEGGSVSPSSQQYNSGDVAVLLQLRPLNMFFKAGQIQLVVPHQILQSL